MKLIDLQLLDDVLSYIGPSLEKHKGCDILDLNPGAGLWSQKLHDFLRPRRHILLEPELSKFKHFLDPLVEQPNSKYQLLERNPCDFPVFSELIDDGYLPDQKRVTPGAPKAQEPNNTLLVTGQIIWDPKMPGVGFDSMAKQVLLHYANAAWTNQLCHALGPVRMLLWIARDDLKNMVPRTQATNAKTSFWLQMTSHITEVVSPGVEVRSNNASGSREHRYRLESLALALKRGEENGMKLPAHRREDAHDFAEEILERTQGTAIMAAKECSDYLKEQFNNGKNVNGFLPQQILESWQFDKDVNYDTLPKRKTAGVHREHSPKDPKARAVWNTMTIRRANVNANDKMRVARDRIVDLGDNIFQLECAILGYKDGTKKKAEALMKLDEWQKQFDEEYQKVDKNFRTAILTDLDDRWTIRSPVERLLWDTRPFEPLIMEPSEMWPAKGVSLVDVTPRPIPEGEAGELFEWVKDFTFGLMFEPQTPLPHALEKMQPGASEIIENVPILRDAQKGGRLNMDNMRVRMLTPEMVVELTKAYKEWPFRSEDANHSSHFKMKTGSPSRKINIAEL